MQFKPTHIEGHRGCRGLMPENTIPGFIKAVQLGVSILEMDVVISKDNHVVVSHEPWMSAAICLDRDGNNFSPEREHELNLYEMNYKSIAEFDCGSKYNPAFPKQEKIKVQKPLLSDVIDSVETYCQLNKIKAPVYNIEIKSHISGDGIFHPKPQEFCRLIIEVAKTKNIESRYMLQSFDIRILQYLHHHHPEVTLAYLVKNNSTITKNLALLGFTPDIYSPYKDQVDSSVVEYCKKMNLKLNVWTVNDPVEMKKLLDMHINSLVTDYPDLAFLLKQ